MNIQGIYGTNPFVSGARPADSVASIIRKVCEFYQLEKKDLLSKRRTADLVTPRHMAMFLACELLKHKSIGTISAVFGRDRTTVLWGRDRMCVRLKTDPALQSDFDRLRKALENEAK